MKRISALILTVFTVLTTMGQTPADSTKVLFQTGQRQFSPMLGDNRASMADFIDKVRKAAASDGIDSVVVNGYASPDGNQEEVDSQAIVPPPVANEVEETGSVCVKVTDTALAEDTVAVAPFTTDPLHRFALKTNLLYDAALMPNLELEWRMNSQWSLAVEGALAWWKKDAKHKYYRIAMVSPEIRRWFNTRGPWHGMYAGLFAGVGKYDLENGGTGYMGNDCYMVGFSYGYMWPIGRTLSLEAGIGAGYMYTRYKEYNPFEGHYLYQRTKTLNYFGPLKLKFSLAWRFNDINKPHKNRQAQ